MEEKDKIHLRLKEVFTQIPTDLERISNVVGINAPRLRRMLEGIEVFPFDDVVRILDSITEINKEFVYEGKGRPLNRPIDLTQLNEKKRKNVTKIGKGLDVGTCNKVKTIRKSTGLTQEQFAEKLGTSRFTQTSIENLRNNPSPQYLRGLYDVYNVNINFIITGNGPRFNQQATSDINKLQAENAELKKVIKMLSDLNK